MIIDNSALIDWILFGRPIAEWSAAALHAPTLIDYEFAHAVRSSVLIGRITASEGREAIESFLKLHIERHPARPLLRAMWAHRHDMSAYDASYVALAQLLGAPLLTCDRRLARTARRSCDVIVPA
ncbi:MAG TPA: type II toxin-antitoxin system VapC family toxin [Microbacteriaceae bacterium]